MRKFINWIRYWAIRCLVEKDQPVIFCKNDLCGRPTSQWYGFQLVITKLGEVITLGQCPRCGAVNKVVEDIKQLTEKDANRIIGSTGPTIKTPGHSFGKRRGF